MTDHASQVEISAVAPAVSTEKQPGSTQRISHQIARFLSFGVIAFAALTVGFAFWITREHNQLSGISSERMVSGGFEALEEKLEAVTMDFAIWPEAVNAINEGRLDWVWENIGVSAAVTGTTDLMLILPPNGEQPYGWAPGSPETPSTDLLSVDLISLMREQLNTGVEFTERRAVSTYVRNGDAIWLLSSARMVSDNPSEDPALDSEIPRLIFGYELDEEQVNGIGVRYLIDDLSLSESPEQSLNEFLLLDSGGSPLARAVWSAPRPGDEILRSIALPLAVGLGLLTLIAFISSSLLSRSARRLETTMLAAQTASRAKTDFIANISHELRTPMNGILGLTTLLQQTELDGHQSNMMRMLRSSAETQMNLIGDLLEISSIENGHISLNLAPFSPASIVQSVVGLFEFEADGKGLDLRLDLSGAENMTVIGDKERYRQICANVVSNAVKFTSQGEVLVRLRARTRMGETFVTLEVTDSGPGIDPGDQEQIFERFAQGRSRQSGKASGTGLGLAITKTIAELMGGEITVSSRVGEGATFTVEIPFGTDQAEQQDDSDQKK